MIKIIVWLNKLYNINMTRNTIVIKMRFANNFNGMENTKCSQIYKMCVYICQNNMLISMTNN